mmetsp:Transcript_80289/g.167174  ORF Transcript_80289/g.167174 Transcript_80289/m.167174 type:complete len:127 (+) Transcript_80289:78-458(+)
MERRDLQQCHKSSLRVAHQLWAAEGRLDIRGVPAPGGAEETAEEAAAAEVEARRKPGEGDVVAAGPAVASPFAGCCSLQQIGDLQARTPWRRHFSDMGAKPLPRKLDAGSDMDAAMTVLAAALDCA